MAAPSLRITYRGVIRGQLRSINRRCGSLLEYDSRHTADFQFLTPAEYTQVQDFRTLMERKLNMVGSPLPPA